MTPGITKLSTAAPPSGTPLPAFLTPLTLQFLFLGLLWTLIGVLALRFVLSLLFGKSGPSQGHGSAPENAPAVRPAKSQAKSQAAVLPGSARVSAPVALPDEDLPVRELLVEAPAPIGELPRAERIVLGSSEITIGRSSESRLKLDDEFASLNHAVLRRQDGALTLEDLGSTNGTFVNDRQVIAPVFLNHGDTIRIGKTTIKLQ